MRVAENKPAHSLEQPPGWAMKIRRSFRRRGFRGTIRLAALKVLHRLQGAIFDRRYGVETSGNVELQDLNIESPNVIHGIRYQPTPTGAFRQMMNALDIPARDFVFVDFGCGKGRTLLLAADFGFKRVIGVEFSSDLAGVAAANARKARLERQVEVVCQDASEFEPPADKCVFYFFLPFVDPIMSKVVDNIKRSLARNPRQFRIVCYDPPKVGPFEEDPAFQAILRGPLFTIYGHREAKAACS
jgi:SAM-dependent methyltransferase